MNMESLAKQIYKEEIANATKPDEVLSGKIRFLEGEFQEPYNSAGIMAIEDIISPPTTRAVLIERLKRLSKKTGCQETLEEAGSYPFMTMGLVLVLFQVWTMTGQPYAIPVQLMDTGYDNDYWASVVLIHFMREGNQKLSIAELIKKYPYRKAKKVVGNAWK